MYLYVCHVRACKLTPLNIIIVFLFLILIGVGKTCCIFSDVPSDRLNKSFQVNFYAREVDEIRDHYHTSRYVDSPKLVIYLYINWFCVQLNYHSRS